MKLRCERCGKLFRVSNDLVEECGGLDEAFEKIRCFKCDGLDELTGRMTVALNWARKNGFSQFNAVNVALRGTGLQLKHR
jgi:hypothetical protein